MARAKKAATSAGTAVEPTPEFPIARVADYSILVRPVITEKASVVGGSGGLLIFKVRRDANKIDIRSAVERIFKVKVAKVRTVQYMGKIKKTKNAVGRRAAFKKAYVTLAPGQTVDIVEGL